MASSTALSVGEQMAFVYLGFGILLPLIASMVISLVLVVACRLIRCIKTTKWTLRRDKVVETKTTVLNKTTSVWGEMPPNSPSRWAGVRQRVHAVGVFSATIGNGHRKVAFE